MPSEKGSKILLGPPMILKFWMGTNVETKIWKCVLRLRDLLKGLKLAKVEFLKASKS